MREANDIFDYAFVGAGASTTLLLRSMESRGLLLNKKVVIIDPDFKLKNDKTYCFWSSEDEKIAIECRHLISQSWKQISVNRTKPEFLDKLSYSLIRSLDLYEEGRRIIHDNQLNRINNKVIFITKKGVSILIQTPSDCIIAHHVFDSRPPSFHFPKKNEIILWQSFFGIVIKPMATTNQITCVELMDFKIPQQGYTQFMYVLPMADDRILVEVTRFGKEPISSSNAEPILSEYIKEQFGNYSILEKESGIIPMSSSPIKAEKIDGLVNIGARAGEIKPSTGYAFKNMFDSAEFIAEQIKLRKPIQTKPNVSFRFQFYDRLLLMILSHYPHLGKPIFSILFEKNSISTVFKFLDGRTNIWRDIQIFATLPFRPFLKVLKIEFSQALIKLRIPSYTLLFSLFFLITQIAFPQLSFPIQITFIIIGFLILGIPHGAVDYLIESGIQGKGIRLSFVLKYIGLSILFLIIWYCSSTLALMLFLSYSIWHFGQCDFKSWIPNHHNIWKNILWGSLLFGILLMGHQTETNKVLSSLHTFEFPFTTAQSKLLSQLLILLSLVWSIVERQGSFFLTICMLFVGLYLPLLSAFSLYFIGQHSLNGWCHLKMGLKTNNSVLYLKSLPFTIGAVFLLGLTYWISNKYLIFYKNFNAAAIFFVFLSCISFPHIIWMNKFYKNKKF